MSKKNTLLTHLPSYALKNIIQDCVSEPEISCFLYDASGQLVLSLSEEGTPEADAQPPETIEIVSQSALAVINGDRRSENSHSRCLTQTIDYQGAVQGVLVAWIGQNDIAFQALSLWERVVGIIAHRIEDLFANQEQIGNLQQEIVDRTHAEQTVRDSEKRFRELFEQSNDATFIHTPEGEILDVNNRACELLLYDADQLRSVPFLSLLVESNYSAGKEALQIAHTKGSVRFESRFKKANGQIIDAEVSARLINPHTRMIQGVVRDITERKQMEAKLRHHALHDALTGLPNRTLFLNRLEQAIGRSKRGRNYIFAVLFLDLDRFKVINDSLGHAIGDEMLIRFAQRLKHCLRPEDTVARLGGDEFTILLDNNIKDINDVINIADRIRDALTSAFNLNGHEIITTSSIGIVMSGRNYGHPEDVLRDADAAMYRAKLQRNHYEVFDPGMHAEAVARLKLEMNLRRAIQEEQFRLYYQPLVSLETNQIIGFEALLRWEHPDWGIVPPAEFVPIAEEIGVIVPIGCWALREACRQMQAWHTQFPTDTLLTINVNLSPKQFMQPDFVEQVEHILRETDLDPPCLNLEITERLIMEDIQSTRRTLSQLKSLNVRLQIDDFGTGYSSLSSLHQFPVDTLKIDRSFVSKMDVDEENLDIVRTLMSLTRNLGMEVTAEGIETAEQLVQLKGLDCERGQGYYFSHPLDAEGATALIATQLSSDEANEPMSK